MIRPEEFIDLMDEGGKPSKTVRFGTVAPDYTTGRPSIIFDGMNNPSVKKYTYLSSYIPAANDRVIIIKGVVIGKVL